VLAAVASVLRECGYEPRTDGDGIVLGNCPFDALARDHAGVVCTMNLELVDGLVAGIEGSGLSASLDAAPGRCCVRIRSDDESERRTP